MNILPKNIGTLGSVEVTFSSYQKVKGLRTLVGNFHSRHVRLPNVVFLFRTISYINPDKYYNKI